MVQLPKYSGIFELFVRLFLIFEFFFFLSFVRLKMFWRSENGRKIDTEYIESGSYENIEKTYLFFFSITVERAIFKETPISRVIFCFPNLCQYKLFVPEQMLKKHSKRKNTDNFIRYVQISINFNLN